MVARGSNDWFVYRCVAFGLASGPLLWGRIAASAARFAQATFASDELRLQTYVDDPAGGVAGQTRNVRTRLLTILLLLLRALGFQLSWKKVQRGRAIDWIGANFRLSGADALTVELSADKVDHLKELTPGVPTLGRVWGARAAPAEPGPADRDRVLGGGVEKMRCLGGAFSGCCAVSAPLVFVLVAAAPPASPI